MNGKYISGEEVISDAAKECNDEAMREQSIGWYRRAIYRALTELNVQERFNGKKVAIVDVPEDLMMSKPEGVYALHDVYAFTCGCGANTADSCCCDTSNTKRVMVKFGFNNMPFGGAGHTAPRKTGGMQSDGFNPVGSSGYDGELWIKEEDVTWMLSPSFASYDRMKIIYAGVITKNRCIDVPIEMHGGLVDWIAERFYRIKANADPRFRGQAQDYYSRLRDPEGPWRTGTRALKRMSPKESSDMMEYLSRGNW